MKIRFPSLSASPNAGKVNTADEIQICRSSTTRAVALTSGSIWKIDCRYPRLSFCGISNVSFSYSSVRTLKRERSVDHLDLYTVRKNAQMEIAKDRDR